MQIFLFDLTFLDHVSLRHPRGPAAGGAGGCSALFCLEECLEVDSPDRRAAENEDDAVEYQRRSFEQLIIARSKQSLEKGDLYVLVETGVQTEQVCI